MTVVITPVGTRVDFPVTGSPQGAMVGSGTASDGRRIYVITEPTGASTQAPFDDLVIGIAQRLAARF